MEYISSSSALFITCLLALISCQQAQDSTTNNPYVGEWESITSENLGNGTFATRHFDLSSDTWEIKFILYLDSLQNTPVFEFRGKGSYTLQGQSEVIEGANNAIFHFDTKYVTLLTDSEEIINNFGFIGCDLQKGIEKNITDTGCSFLVSKTVCAQEYDVLKLDRGQLFFGMRPSEGDLCTEERRPRKLFYPLKRG